jgi:nitronate monooxygenase
MRTPLCDLLAIEVPVLQSGMGRIAGPELVAQVSNAGGLGILAGLGVPGEDLRQQIRRVRELTRKPFGVNLWLHEELLPPKTAAEIPDGDVQAVQRALNPIRRRLGLPERHDRPAPYPDVVADAFEVILEEGVPVWSIGLGNPDPARVDRCHAAGVVVMAMATSVADARALSTSGVDVIAAQGLEAGGHRSTWKRPAGDSTGVSTLLLVPQIVDAVRQPVVAAGGIADGRGVAAALALGAQGALLGTRFVATQESLAPPMFKQALLAATTADTVITTAYSGLPARALRSRFVDEYQQSGAPVLPSLLQTRAAEDIYAAAAQSGDREHYPMMAGQSAGLVSDLPSASDVVRTIVAEADAALRRVAAFSGT